MSQAIMSPLSVRRPGPRQSIGFAHRARWKLVRTNGGRAIAQRVLMLFQAHRPEEVFTLFQDFIFDKRKLRNLAWQAEAAHAVGCLIDFFAANRGAFTQQTRQDAYEAFALALRFGTFNDDNRDPAALCWRPRSQQRAEKVLSKANEFTDWLAAKTGTQLLNPWREAFPNELIVKAWNAHKRAGASGLSHLRGYAEAPRKDLVRSTRIENFGGPTEPSIFEVPETWAFDVSRFDDFIRIGLASRREGVRARAKREHRQGLAALSPAPFDVRNAMIAMLQLGAGLRLGEAFHLYVSDVWENPDKPGHAVVRLYHPCNGAAPDDAVTQALRARGVRVVDRLDYLYHGFGLQPRNLATGGYRAAWKNLLLTNGREHYAQVYFFPETWSAAFLQLYRHYVTYIRPRQCAHPFLFATEHGEQRGQPYSPGRYRIAFAQAIKRLKLKQSRYTGTTPHGLRHAYGQALAAAGVAPAEIQQCMHHCSLESQRRYTTQAPAQVSDALNRAMNQMDENAKALTSIGDWLEGLPVPRSRR